MKRAAPESDGLKTSSQDTKVLSRQSRSRLILLCSAGFREMQNGLNTLFRSRTCQIAQFLHNLVEDHDDPANQTVFGQPRFIGDKPVEIWRKSLRPIGRKRDLRWRESPLTVSMRLGKVLSRQHLKTPFSALSRKFFRHNMLPDENSETGFTV